jgi:hypothetical protein
MFPMTFERKTLATVAIEGDLEGYQTPSIDILSIKTGPTQHLLLVGVTKRRENDAEEVLQLALKLRSPKRKIHVSMETILIEGGKPSVEWNRFANYFTPLAQNEIGVSIELVRIYQRVFEIRSKKIKKQTLFLVESKKENPDRIRGLQKKYSPLVGRQKELSTLMDIIEQSFEDQGQIASIIGEAGLGKSRLKHELTQTLEKKKIPYHEGYFSLNSDMNFRGFHQLTQSILENKTETFTKWNMNDSESEFLRYFLHPEEKNDIVKDLNEEEIKQAVFHSIHKLYQQAGQNKMVLILDDFHWAGDMSTLLLDHLTQTIDKTKIAFFILHRPTFVPSFKKRLNYHQIKLSPLANEETKQLVKNVLKLDHISEKATQALTDISLGNPLYVEEVLRELISQKKLDISKEQDLHRLIEIQFPQGNIPTNVQALLVSRFDQLSKESKEILQWICAFGFRENQDDFELFLKTTDYSADTFHQLFTQGYLEEASQFPEHKYKFQHDLLYETIKQTIPETEWKQKNQQIAEFLYDLYKNDFVVHGDRIADFYLKGLNNSDSFVPISEAAKSALNQRRYSSAIKYFNQCHQLFTNFKIQFDSSELFEPYLQALFASGEKEKIQNIINEWKKNGFSNKQSEIKYNKLYLEFLFTYREFNLLLDNSKKILEEMKDLDSEFRIAFEIKYFQANAYLDHDKAIHYAHKILKNLNSAPNSEEHKIDVLYYLSFVLQQLGYPDIATQYILIAKNISDTLNNFKQKITIQKRIGYLATTMGYYKDALRIWADLIHSCDEQGYLLEKNTFQNNLTMNNYFLGDYKTILNDKKYLENLDKKDWDDHYTLIWISQIYQSMGCFKQVKNILIANRFYPQNDMLISSHKFFFLGHYHFQNGDIRRAEINYRRSKSIYKKKNLEKFTLFMQGLELQCKLLQKTLPIGEIEILVDKIMSYPGLRKYYNFWYLKVLSFFFARHGCNLRFKPSEDWDPMECHAAHMRMQMFVEKIKWLRFVGKNEAADKLKKQYLQHRQEMSFYVPDEYKQSYLNHPFYQVD